ncbi:MAG: DUF2892 domain-containing protein [Gammaproteobacteria bacterium]|jgi:hypothetical protein|nr:MAG: DUF2892 domain-containing protein [Gammaproteobacteria bacterium]RLA24115.1 MAG: DUF2892 domain-containing protein [Gammaproteobacteria bacterium]
MKANVGGTDKILRIVVGLAVCGWGVATQNVLGAIGLVPLLTGFINFCPLYTLLGVNTGAKSEEAGE